MIPALFAIYLVGAFVTFMGSYVGALEDDHMKTAARSLYWPIYAVVLFLKVGLVAGKELLGK